MSLLVNPEDYLDYSCHEELTLIHDHAFLFQNVSPAAQIYTDGEKHRCLDADADRVY